MAFISQQLNSRPEHNQHQPDRDPVVDDDFDPAAEPEPEVEDPGVFFGLGEALVLRDDLSREKRLQWLVLGSANLALIFRQ